MKRILSIAFLLAVTALLLAAPPFDARWDGEGYRPVPLTPVPGVTQLPTWMILSDNVAATAWLKALDDSSAPNHVWQWHKKWRQPHPTDNRVAIQIRAEENVCMTTTEYAQFIPDPLPAEWYVIPDMQ